MKTLKKALSLILALAMILGMAVTASAGSFDKETIKYQEAVDVMNGLGIIEGFPDGTFRPTETLTRAQASKIISMMLALEKVSVSYTPHFTDVVGTWAEKFIAICEEQGIVAGYGNGLFGPNDTLTGFQFAKMLLCAMGYDAEAEGLVGTSWEVGVTKLIKAQSLTKGVKDWDGAAALPREAACQLAFNALKGKAVTYKKGVAVKNADSFGFEYLGLDKTTTERDDWGRPYVQWFTTEGEKEDGSFDKKKDTKVCQIKDEPVAEFTVATKGCDVVDLLGEDDDVTVVKWYVNGKVDTAKKTIADSSTKYGAQGQLVEIYENGDDYDVVVVDTYIGTVTKVTKCTYDKKGHLDDEATLEISYYDAAAEEDKTLKLEDDENFAYEKGDVVLLNVNAAEEDNSVILGLADKEVVVATAIDAAKISTYYKVDDEKFTYAVNFTGDKFVKADVENEIKKTVYFDQYGNPIKTDEVTAAEGTVYILEDAKWVKASAGNYYIEATVLGFDGEEATINVTSNGKKIGTEEDADKYQKDLELDLGGLYVAAEVAKEDYLKFISVTDQLVKNPTMKAADPDSVRSTRAGILLVDSKTVFALAQYDAKGNLTGYEFLNGIKELPNLVAIKNHENIEGEYVVLNAGKASEYAVVLIKFAELSTIKPAKTVTVDPDAYIYVLDDAATEYSADYVDYGVIKAGKKTTLRASKALGLATNCMYEATLLKGEYVYTATPVFGDDNVVYATVLASATGEAIKNDVLYLNNDRLVVAEDYSIVDAKGEAVDAEDLKTGDRIWAIKNNDGYVQYIIVPKGTATVAVKANITSAAITAGMEFDDVEAGTVTVDAIAWTPGAYVTNVAAIESNLITEATPAAIVVTRASFGEFKFVIKQDCKYDVTVTYVTPNGAEDTLTFKINAALTDWDVTIADDSSPAVVFTTGAATVKTFGSVTFAAVLNTQNYKNIVIDVNGTTEAAVAGVHTIANVTTNVAIKATADLKLTGSSIVEVTGAAVSKDDNILKVDVTNLHSYTVADLRKDLELSTGASIAFFDHTGELEDDADLVEFLNAGDLTAVVTAENDDDDYETEYELVVTGTPASAPATPYAITLTTPEGTSWTAIKSVGTAIVGQNVVITVSPSAVSYAVSSAAIVVTSLTTPTTTIPANMQVVGNVVEFTFTMPDGPVSILIQDVVVMDN